MGIVDYKTFLGKSLYVIEGTLYGKNENAVYEGMELLRKVFNPVMAQNDNYSDSGYLPMSWTENGVSKSLYMKPLYIDIPETRKSAMKPMFRILFKVKYPFIVGAEQTTDFSPPTVVAGDGLDIPSTGLQIPTGGVNIGGDSGTGSGTVINNGDYRAYPTFNLTAPINIPKITNSSTGKFIQFNYNLASGTAIIAIDYDGVTATASDGTNLLQYLTADSDIENFYLQPGNNNITLTGSSMTTATEITCTWRDTWPS